MKRLILLGVTALLAIPLFAQSENVSPTVRQLEEKWENAILKRDTKTVGEMLANDYVGVNEKGEHENRADLLSRMNKETDTLTSAKIADLTVHVYGPNVAVAIGDAAEQGKDKDGKSFDRVFRFTDTWMERDGKWQCIAEQVVELKGRP